MKNRIKSILAEKEIKAGWLAEKMGWHKTKLSRVVNGRQSLDLAQKEKIAALLDTEISKIWNNKIEI